MLPSIDPGLPPRIRAYIDAIAYATSPICIILFGSGAKGGFTQQVSDVDLIVILPDDTTPQQPKQTYDEVSRREIAHGFKPPPTRRNILQHFAERTGGNDLSCFVCTRTDLLSATPARIFNLHPAEALFVDRIVLANIIASSITAYGQDLLPLVHPPPVRRLDVLKACFAFTNQIIFTLLAYPFLTNATKYAMGTLKRSLHSCYFCYHHNNASLNDEAAFFQRHLGPSQTLTRLLQLRTDYRNSFTFILRCLPTLLHLHSRTVFDNSFSYTS